MASNNHFFKIRQKSRPNSKKLASANFCKIINCNHAKATETNRFSSGGNKTTHRRNPGNGQISPQQNGAQEPAKRIKKYEKRNESEGQRRCLHFYYGHYCRYSSYHFNSGPCSLKKFTCFYTTDALQIISFSRIVGFLMHL